MKKLLLFLLISASSFQSFGQDPDLIGDWQLTELHIDGNTYTAPSNSEIELIWMDILNPSLEGFFTKACDWLAADITFTGSTELELSNRNQNLIGCFDFDNLDYQLLYFDFYLNNGANFTYEITPVGGNGVKQLIIRDINNNLAIYNSELLRQYVFKKWYLQYMIINGVDIPVPVDGSPFDPEIEFGHTFDPAVAGFTGNAGCSTYSGVNTFVSDERVVTLTSNSVDVMTCATQAQTDFEAIYLDFLFSSSPETFNYLYIDVQGTIVFYLQNDENNYAVYGEEPPRLGVPESNLVAISIFPNPVSETLFITSEGIPIQQISIYAISGKRIISETSLTNQIDVSGLKSGLYFVELTTSEGRSIQKFIKK